MEKRVEERHLFELVKMSRYNARLINSSIFGTLSSVPKTAIQTGLNNVPDISTATTGDILTVNGEKTGYDFAAVAAGDVTASTFSGAGKLVQTNGANKTIAELTTNAADVVTATAAFSGAGKLVQTGGADKTIAELATDAADLTTASAAFTAAGNVLQSGGVDKTITELAAGSARQTLRMNTGGTAAEWATPYADTATVDATMAHSGANGVLTAVDEVRTSTAGIEVRAAKRVRLNNTNNDGFWDLTNADATTGAQTFEPHRAARTVNAATTDLATTDNLAKVGSVAGTITQTALSELKIPQTVGDATTDLTTANRLVKVNTSGTITQTTLDDTKIPVTNGTAATDLATVNDLVKIGTAGQLIQSGVSTWDAQLSNAAVWMDGGPTTYLKSGAIMQTIQSTDHFQMGFWVKFAPLKDGSAILALKNSAGQATMVFTRAGADLRLVKNDVVTKQMTGMDSFMPPNKWNFFVFKYNRTAQQFELYVNGAIISYFTVPFTAQTWVDAQFYIMSEVRTGGTANTAAYIAYPFVDVSGSALTAPTPGILGPTGTRRLLWVPDWNGLRDISTVAPSYRAEGPFDDINQRLDGSAIHFNGETSYIRSDQVLATVDGTKQYQFGAWIKFRQTGRSEALLNVSVPDRTFIGLFKHSSDIIQIQAWDGASTVSTSVGTLTTLGLGVDEWHFYVCNVNVKGGGPQTGGITVYIDGQKVGFTTTIEQSHVGHKFYVGSEPDVSNAEITDPFDGSMACIFFDIGTATATPTNPLTAVSPAFLQPATDRNLLWMPNPNGVVDVTTDTPRDDGVGPLSAQHTPDLDITTTAWTVIPSYTTRRIIATNTKPITVTVLTASIAPGGWVDIMQGGTGIVLLSTALQVNSYTGSTSTAGIYSTMRIHRRTDSLELDVDVTPDFDTAIVNAAKAEYETQPVYTAATTLSHTVTASSEYSPDWAAWKACQGASGGGSTNEWATDGVTTNFWIKQTLPTARIVSRVELRGRTDAVEHPLTWRLEGSNNDSTWTTLIDSTTSLTSASGIQSFNVRTATAYKYYQILALTSSGTDPGLSVFRLFATTLQPTAATFAPETVTGYFSGARVYLASALSVVSSTLTAVPFTLESFDTSGYHDNGTNTTRLTVGTYGFYRIEGCARWDTNAVGTRALGYRVNGGTIERKSWIPTTADGVGNMFSETLLLEAADYVEMIVYQDSGSNLNLAADGTSFTIQKVGFPTS